MAVMPITSSMCRVAQAGGYGVITVLPLLQGEKNRRGDSCPAAALAAIEAARN